MADGVVYFGIRSQRERRESSVKLKRDKGTKKRGAPSVSQQPHVHVDIK